MIAMLSTVSASPVLAAVSSTSSGVTFVAGVVGGLAAGIILYLLVYRYSARRLPEVRAEEAPELLKKLGERQTPSGWSCLLRTTSAGRAPHGRRHDRRLRHRRRVADPATACRPERGCGMSRLSRRAPGGEDHG